MNHCRPAQLRVDRLSEFRPGPAVVTVEPPSPEQLAQVLVQQS